MTRFASNAVRPLSHPICRASRFQEHVDVIRHKHPRSEIIASIGALDAELLLRRWRPRVLPATVVRKTPHPATRPPRRKPPHGVVHRSATAATGNEPANRHVTKYPTPPGCSSRSSKVVRAATELPVWKPSAHSASISIFPKDAAEVACPGHCTSLARGLRYHVNSAFVVRPLCSVAQRRCCAARLKTDSCSGSVSLSHSPSRRSLFPRSSTRSRRSQAPAETPVMGATADPPCPRSSNLPMRSRAMRRATCI